MKRLALIVLLSICSLVIPQQALGTEQIKAGTKCTKANLTQTWGGKKFTCVKSGSKLVWNNGVKIANSVARKEEVTPNPFNLTPFPDQFTRAQMVEAALKSFDEYVKLNTSKQAFKLIIDKDFEHKSTEITKLVEGIFSSLPFPSGYPTSVFVVTRDRAFLETSIKEFSDFYKPGLNQLEVRPCFNCANIGWASTNLGLSNVIPHEIFHVWQQSFYNWELRKISNDPTNHLNPPIWLDEGGAEFFGNIFYRRVEDYYPGSLVKSKPYRLKDYITRDIDGQLPYSLGRLASEYIVASKGYGKFLSIYSNVGLGQDFPTAFENAMGISVEKFYEKFDSNLQKML